MKRLKFFTVLFFSFLITAVYAQKSQWENMFNGKSIKGWKTLGGKAEYVVEDGCITGISTLDSPNSFLTTGKEYTDFVLEYEMKMDAGLNSGVQIRSHSIPSYQNGRVHGLQIECDDSKRAWSGGIYDEGRKGWRYPLEYNPASKTAFKNGDWNSYKVIAVGNRIITYLNGVACANLFEEEAETGFIALQVHAIKEQELAGKKIQWRNIRIKPATAEDIASLGTINAPEVSYLKNQLTENEVKAGWKLLWDGATTNGWRGARLDKFPEHGWQIKDGELSVLKGTGAESTNGGDIVTTELYKNFELELEFKLTEGANSGVKYFVNTDLNKGEGSAIGCEFQILDDLRHPDAKLGTAGNRTLGSLYDIITANGKMFNPNLPTTKYVNGMEFWNKARIVVNGNKVEHYLNGCKVVEYERGNQMWRALVAFSKFKNWPNFGEAPQGHILLQDHGNEVSFRSIKIREF